MQVSNKNKKRFLRFLLGQNGYITSGRTGTDGLLRWIFERLAVEAYAHERIGEVGQLIEELERDGLVTCERNEQRKLFAVRLADDVPFEADDFAEESYATEQEWRSALLILAGRVAHLQQQLDHSDGTEALEIAFIAERQRDEALRRVSDLEAEIAARSDTTELERRIARLEPELERVKAENCILTRKVDFQEHQSALLRDDAATFRRDTNRNLSLKGNEIAALNRKLAIAEEMVVNTHEKMGELARLAIANGVAEDEVRTLMNRSIDTP